MVILSFSISEHKPMLLDGRKDQTIRLFTKKRYEEIGSAKNLEIYWKLRLPHSKGGSEKLFDARPLEVFPIYLYASFGRMGFLSDPWPWYAQPDGTLLSRLSIDQTFDLVRRDGFKYRNDLYDALEKLHGAKDLTKLFFVTRFAKKVA